MKKKGDWWWHEPLVWQKSLKNKPDPWILSPLNSDSSDIQLVTWSLVSLRNTVLKKGYEPWHSSKSPQPVADAAICKSVNSLMCLDNKTGVIHKALIWNDHFGQPKDTKVYLNWKHMPCTGFGGLELSVIHFVIEILFQKVSDTKFYYAFLFIRQFPSLVIEM